MITPLSLDASSPAARPEFIIRSRRISLGGQPMSPNTSQHHNKHHLPGSSHHKPTDGRAGCVLGFATVFSTHHLISEEKKGTCHLGESGDPRIHLSTISQWTLKVPCNQNACRPLLNRIDLYVTYLTIWEYELVSYIL